MNHRIRVCFGLVMPKKLCEEVEVDETFVGGKNRNRHANKKVQNSRSRSFKDKTPVLGMLQRGGMVVCQVVHNTSYKALTPPIIKTIKLRTTLYSDEWSGYNVISKFYQHYIVDHDRRQYVDGNAYTNTIEGFWGILKFAFWYFNTLFIYWSKFYHGSTFGTSCYIIFINKSFL